MSKAGGIVPRRAKQRDELARFLSPSRLVVTGGQIGKIAAELQRGEPNFLILARRFYDHVGQEMRYAKPDGEPWGRGDA